MTQVGRRTGQKAEARRGRSPRVASYQVAGGSGREPEKERAVVLTPRQQNRGQSPQKPGNEKPDADAVREFAGFSLQFAVTETES